MILMSDTDREWMERYLSSITSDMKGLRADLHAWMVTANKVDAEQGIQIAILQSQMIDARREIELGSSDRHRLWERVWQFGVTGALIAQIALGGALDSVTFGP
jgi:hypothetical protein